MAATAALPGLSSDVQDSAPTPEQSLRTTFATTPPRWPAPDGPAAPLPAGGQTHTPAPATATTGTNTHDAHTDHVETAAEEERTAQVRYESGGKNKKPADRQEHEQEQDRQGHGRRQGRPRPSRPGRTPHPGRPAVPLRRPPPATPS
jgi:hypothetical protein